MFSWIFYLSVIKELEHEDGVDEWQGIKHDNMKENIRKSVSEECAL